MCIYELIDKMRLSYPGRMLCKLLDVSYSAYYSWKRGESHQLSSNNSILANKVKAVFDEHLRRYGSLRIKAELQSQGIRIGRYKVRAMMQIQNLKAIQPKSFVPKTTQSNPAAKRSPNLLLDRGAPTKPNEVFVGDITFIPMHGGKWTYLATWLDLFTHEIAGWELGKNMKSSLIINALDRAIDRRVLPVGLIVHSDGGGQYSSDDFRSMLHRLKFVQSMTRKDNHYDNAAGESLFSRIKAELIQKGSFATFEEAYTAIFDYIEVYYNRKRRHSSIGYDIPFEFARKYDSKSNE